MIRMMTTSAPARYAVLFSAIWFVGCDQGGSGKRTTDANVSGDKQQTGPSDDTPAKAKQPQKKTSGEKTTQPVDPVPPIAEVPPVVMSKQHRDSMTVYQNDALPAEILDGQLVGLDGKTHTLRSAMGEKLTILLFWSSDHAYAVEELKYLATNVAQQFGERGVKVVTLLDPEKSLGKLASGNVPRTYLLDAQGRVLWLDTVFDRTTRRYLNGALVFVLDKNREVIGSSTAKDGSSSKHR